MNLFLEQTVWNNENDKPEQFFLPRIGLHHKLCFHPVQNLISGRFGPYLKNISAVRTERMQSVRRRSF